MRRKVVIIGAGHVGSHVARALAAADDAPEIVLTDIVPGKAEAQAMDIADAFSWPPREAAVRAGAAAECADAAVTVVAVGKPREPGQTRLDLLADSVRMVRDLAGELRQTPPGGLVISITNPCDIIADCLRRLLGMPRERVFGTGTLLDTARLVRTLHEQTGVPRAEISAVVLGEHGDSSMIPFGAIRLAGKPAAEVPGYDPAACLARTHGIGMDIIEGKGSTEFGIGQSATHLIRTLLRGEEAVLPLSVSLEGEYGVRGIHCGVPCRVGPEGIRGIPEVPMTAQERQAFDASVGVLAKHTAMALELLA